MRLPTSITSRLRDLPIFWKLLVPFVLLLLLVGGSGTFIVVRALSLRSERSLSEQLTLRVVEARSAIHDSELDLLESANYSSNLNGMADALRARDDEATRHLLQSVAALKTDLRVVAATTADGTAVADLGWLGAGGRAVSGALVDWSRVEPFRRAVRSTEGDAAVGFFRGAEDPLMIMVSPVCASSPPCDLAGYTIVGLDASAIIGPEVDITTKADTAPPQVTMYDPTGARIAATNAPVPEAPSPVPQTTQIVFQRARLGDHTSVTAYTGFKLAGRPAGTIGVTLPASYGAASAGPAAARLVALVVAAMLLAALAGAAVSSVILRQLRALVDTSRRLGEGELSTRAQVFSRDEHGELAMTLNRMAEQLEASHETLESQVEERTQEIHRLLRDRTEFFAGLSHELRTPIAIILAQADMLLGRGGDKMRVEAGEAIRLSAAQLLDVVNDILDLARTEAGTIEVDLQPVALDELLTDLHPMLANMSAAADISLTFEVSGGGAIVAADAARLREVVVNLVDNAVKYTPEGGTIGVLTDSDADVVRVSVTDSGVGIPDEVGDRVFEPFYRVAGTRPQRGQASTGLGLALVRRWVEAQGGTITWRTRPEGGTTFTFTLSRVPGPPDVVDASAAELLEVGAPAT